MAIRDIELFHGVALSKLLRKRPESISLVEFNADKSSAAYQINATNCYLYIKHSKTPFPRQRGFSCVWQFSFNTNHLEEIQNLQETSEVYSVLICGDSDLNNNDMFVCFLTPNELHQCIDIQSCTQQSITVGNRGRGNLRVWGSKNGANKPLLIQKSAYDNWEVPGK